MYVISKSPYTFQWHYSQSTSTSFDFRYSNIKDVLYLDDVCLLPSSEVGNIWTLASATGLSAVTSLTCWRLISLDQGWIRAFFVRRALKWLGEIAIEMSDFQIGKIIWRWILFVYWLMKSQCQIGKNYLKDESYWLMKTLKYQSSRWTFLVTLVDWIGCEIKNDKFVPCSKC